MPAQEGKRVVTTLERWQQVHDLRSQNVGLLEYARRLGLSMNTVKRYDRASEPQRLQIDSSAWCSPSCPTSPGRAERRLLAQAPED